MRRLGITRLTSSPERVLSKADNHEVRQWLADPNRQPARRAFKDVRLARAAERAERMQEIPRLDEPPEATPPAYGA